MTVPTLVIVADRGDPLCLPLRREARAAGVSVQAIDRADLAAAPVTIRGEDFLVGGATVTHLVMRARAADGGFGATFRAEDRSFASAEASAVWLAAQHLTQSLLRYDARAWFEPSPWAAWRDALAACGVAVAPLTTPATAKWLPHTAGRIQPAPGRRAGRAIAALSPAIDTARTFLAVAGAAATEDPDDQALAAALMGLGMGFGRVTVDPAGAVIAVDPTPLLETNEAGFAAKEVTAWVLRTS